MKDSKQQERTGRQRQAKVLRLFRKIHKVTASLTFIIFFIVSITGLLLTWKKHSGGLILPDTQTGTSTNKKDWLSLDTLEVLAIQGLEAHNPKLNPEVDRIDVRPSKGVMKFTFTDHYYEVQIDATTGNIMHVKRRFSDLFEKIHDGSIVDKWLNISGDWFKLTYANIAALSLLIFTITGFWLWYGPKVMRKGN
ncbi:MAG: PepSY-associated TM helix domain-containing protein [Saprospiraceae bacterium]|nr:PepSY-associated TM helix domain-containing protein [Saprospiraceae bacterium]